MFIKSCILNMYTVLFLSFPVFLGVIISCLVPVLLPVFFFFCCFSSLCLAPPSFSSPTSAALCQSALCVYMWSCSLVCMFVL